MEKFRVAVIGAYGLPDGRSAFELTGLMPFADDLAIDFVPVESSGIVQASDVIGFDAVILRANKMPAESFPNDDRLAIVARFGVSYDNVDLEACARLGVAVTITPDGVRRPVAVAEMTLLLALTTNLFAKDRLTRSGPEAWANKNDYLGLGLVGLTLGSIGVGNIGAELFRLAAPFGMRHLGTDPYIEPASVAGLGVTLVDLETLAREADVLAVNCPLSEETRHLVGARELALMKPTAYLINTARGGIVDEAALYEVLSSRRIAGAGIDVFGQEPLPAEAPLLGLDNVILAPHALAHTNEIVAGNGLGALSAVLEVMAGRVPAHIVNTGVAESPAWRAKLESFAARFAGT